VSAAEKWKSDWCREDTGEMQMAHLNDHLGHTLLRENVFEMLAASTKIEGIVKADIINDIR
jgi:hypothetical protein